MNYYPHHIGDFRSGTFNMTRQERWVYRDMIDVYYDTEGPFPDDLVAIYKMMGVRSDEDKELVAAILLLKFELRPTGYHHVRCDEEIAAYRAKAETAKNNGKKGGRPIKNNQEKPSGLSVGSNQVISGNPDETGSKANQEPITNNHNQIQEPIGASAPGASESLLTAMSEDQASTAKPEYPDDFERAWAAYPARHGGNPKKDAFKHWSARKREGEAVADMQAGVERYAAHLKATGKLGTEYVMQAVRFFGTSKQYAEPWPIGSAPQAKQNGRPSINSSFTPGADDDIFNQMRRKL